MSRIEKRKKKRLGIFGHGTTTKSLVEKAPVVTKRALLTDAMSL